MSDAFYLSKELENSIRKLKGDICVAFSGGVDSSVIAKAVKEALFGTEKRAIAVTFETPLQSREDSVTAKKVAEEIGITHTALELDPTADQNVLGNSRERCYFCKKHMFTALLRFCRENGFDTVCDGTNADDTGQYRPGLRAVEELGIISPLKELGYGKKEIVSLAEYYGLSVARRPASPCLATRVPYGEMLDREVLRRLGEGEEMLKTMIEGPLRLRLHGRVLRLEVCPDRFQQVLRLREEITDALKGLGFTYITLDLEGFRSGSMDL